MHVSQIYIHRFRLFFLYIFRYYLIIFRTFIISDYPTTFTYFFASSQMRNQSDTYQHFSLFFADTPYSFTCDDRICRALYRLPSSSVIHSSFASHSSSAWERYPSSHRWSSSATYTSTWRWTEFPAVEVGNTAGWWPNWQPGCWCGPWINRKRGYEPRMYMRCCSYGNGKWFSAT